jgi:phosphonopyruvate decarboxylase
VSICAGAYTAGRKTVVLMQNSGLGNAISPLTSLNAIFHIPVLGFVSLRGEPELGDEPQHELMGVITDKLLSVIEIQWEYLSEDTAIAKDQLKKADTIISQRKSFFFIVRKNTFSKVSLKPEKKLSTNPDLPDRASILKAVVAATSPRTILASTTGFTSRELYELGDVERNFYMVGSLGCLSSFALGINLAKPAQPVVVLDGDGAMLMRLGAIPVIGTYKPARLLHILLDNRAHESTGGQETASSSVHWAETVRALGYPYVYTAHNSNEVTDVVKKWEKDGGLVFLHIAIRQGAPETLGRPKVKPYDVAQRLSKFIQEGR